MQRGSQNKGNGPPRRGRGGHRGGRGGFHGDPSPDSDFGQGYAPNPQGRGRGFPRGQQRGNGGGGGGNGRGGGYRGGRGNFGGNNFPQQGGPFRGGFQPQHLGNMFTGPGNVADRTADVPASVAQAVASGAPSEADVSTWRQKDFHALVKAFVENNESHEITFPPTLTPAQRNTVHKIGMVFGIEHKSYGVAPNRRIKLTKINISAAKQEELVDEAAAKGVRIKCMDGFQGAQILPSWYIDREKVGEMTRSLNQHRKNMLHDLKLEANRPVAKGRKFQTAQPGLSTPPAPPARARERYPELQRFRSSLPTFRRREEIINAVRNNDVVIVSGDTGCGKTTQIPQLLYDAKIFAPGSDVICTQPRRISALSVANRVAEERGEACGDSCGYVIRFENVTSPRTHIVYQTTGILLRRLHSEPELRGVACVIVDEVHERDLDTDFSLLLLRDRLAAQRAEPEKYPEKLKVVVMSATVQIESLVEYFKDSNCGRPAPLISIPGTLFPVREFFLEDAIAWVGGSDSGARTMAAMMEKEAPEVVSTEGMSLYEKLRTSVFNDQNRDAEAMVPYDLVAKLIVTMHRSSNDLSGSILVFLPGWAAISRIADMLKRSDAARELSVLMLHSSLTSAEQQRVFLPPPRRYRKVVLATSIAETSITIDDVVYVIDSGLIKGTTYDPAGNTSALQAAMIAKANGVQRRGRAGRCREGVCVHLLPRTVYGNLPEFLPPEIIRSPLEEICLQVKAIRAEESCASVLARAMDPPPADSVEHAVTFLTEMGAFTEEEELLTNLGRALAQLPLHPILGKMLFAAAIFGVLDSVATIAAGLSVKSPFVKPMNHMRNACRESLERIDGGDLSDHLCVLKLHQGWIRSGRSIQYANEHFADQTTLRSLDRTKLQLVRLLERSPLLRRWSKPLEVASRNDGNKGLVRLAMLWSLYPRIANLEYRANRQSARPNVYCWDNKPATFSMSSVLAMQKRTALGTNTFVVYYERMQLESMLNLFDSSIVSAADVALCVRQLTVRPLTKIPEFLLKDDESKMAPPVRLDLSEMEDKEKFSGLFFDGDKKLFITENAIANLLDVARQCMDYYLALCIKKLRADAFPQDLVKTIATLIGFPLAERHGADSSLVQSRAAVETGATASTNASAGVNAPSFARGGQMSDDSSDEDDEVPIIVEDGDVAAELELTAEQRKKVTAVFGDLLVFREGRIAGLDQPTAVDPGDINVADEWEDDDELIVAQPGDLVPHT